LSAAAVWAKRVALVAGPVAALLIWKLAPIGTGPADLTAPGRLTLAFAAWMAIWWLSEAVELEATALLPLVVFPAAGLMTMKAAAAPYADPTIFFFMGGMMLGAAMERWGLPRRFALHVLLRVGVKPPLLVLGAMTATAIISMWVNNTSTCVMMLPIGIGIVRIIERETSTDTSPKVRKGVDNFATAMILGIAYAATIGGIGTLFGTAPNIILQSNIDKLVEKGDLAERLTFAKYAMIGIPIMVIYLPAAWLVLMWLFPPSLPASAAARGPIEQELADLGPMSAPQRVLLAVLAVAIALWVFMGPINTGLQRATGVDRVLSEASIGVLAALILFLIPARTDDGRATRMLDWHTANSIQWGVLILFGGGLSLAETMSQTGVNTYLGGVFEGLRGVHPFLIVLAVTAVVTFATEIASNTAIATTFLPIAAVAAKSLGLHPYMLMFPVALAASYAFMMPMGTPPNAMAIATGRVRISQMTKAGIFLNIIAILLISTFVYLTMK
jgi:sodium-dependent dicarboxylate transporter 2/3/5